MFLNSIWSFINSFSSYWTCYVAQPKQFFRSRRSYSCLRQLWDRFCLRKFRVYLRLFAITHMDLLENEHHWAKITFFFDWRREWIRAWSSSQFFLVGLACCPLSLFLLFNCFSIVEIYGYPKDSGSKIDIDDCAEIVIRTLENRLYLSACQIRCLNRRCSCWIQFFGIVSRNTTSIPLWCPESCLNETCQ